MLSLYLNMKKILIVDDEKISLMMTNHILSSEYETVCASSGAEALSLYKRENPDMVLSDLRMPEMSGYELQKQLQNETKKAVPFMFMTADTDEDSEIKGFENGAMDFIRKPFRADVLLRRVANIVETVEKIQGLRKASVMDPMTGLLNKAASESEIGSLCRSAQGVLMMIDLDSFKLVNDLYGHDMGDKILIRFSEILQAVVRPIDLVGRMGGDEFIAFCQNVQEEVVIEKKARFINKYIVEAAKEFMGEDMNIPLGASLGCVFVPDEGTDFASLYKKADKALYNVKQNGKHGFAFFKDASAEEKRETAVSSDLKSAEAIFGERNQAKGAYLLPFEQFRTTYRFLARLKNNYKKDVSIMLFTVRETERSVIPLEEGIEQFAETLKDTLRQSDVITQSGKTQFMVLLPETPQMNLCVVEERVRKNWGEQDASAMYQISCEYDSMRRNKDAH